MARNTKQWRRLEMARATCLALVMLTAIVCAGCVTGSNCKESAQLPCETEQDRSPEPYAKVDRAQMGEYWNMEVARFAADNADQAPGGVVMLGDSITAAFPFDTMFPDIPIVNRGISGDRLIGVIARLEESVYALQPSKLFVLIGVNDAALFPDMPLDESERQYRFLFENIVRAGREVFIQSVMPIRGTYAAANPRILQVNALLEELAAEYGFVFIDLHPHFVDEEGEMKNEYSDDGVHPNRCGQGVWAKVLHPYLYGSG